jgi:DNA-binding response OmpR family regulator
MTQTRKLRLDEILLQDSQLTQEQIKEALLRQKMQGGKFGSQLLYHRYIDETTLVKALARQFNCDGVVLSDIVIPESVIKLIPIKLARNRKIIPFEFSATENLLKIACADPTDMGLAGEIGFVVPGKKIKLFVAAELAIDTAINKFYLGRKVNLQDNLLLEIPDDYIELSSNDSWEDKPIRDSLIKRKTILLITDEEFSGPLLQSILERDGFDVVSCQNCPEAIGLIENRLYHTILIKESLYDEKSDIVSKFRKHSPAVCIRIFKDASSLIVASDEISSVERVFTKNLDLFFALIRSKDNLQSDHSCAVGHYADKLCRKLGLSAKDRILIVSAGYLHDLSKYYYGNESATDNRAIIEKSRKLLESLDYSQEVTKLLSRMYCNLDPSAQTELSFEVLGGNILTVVDMFCENLPSDKRLTLDVFDAFKKRLRDFIGKLFLVEVVEPFISAIQDEIINTQTERLTGNVMLYSEDFDLSRPLELRLQSEGFSLVIEHTLNKMAELYHRSLPDILLIILEANESYVNNFISLLEDKHIGLKNVPTVLLVDGVEPSNLTGLFDRGIEDVMAISSNFDLLMVKIHKLIEKSGKSATRSRNSGTKGRLADMSLIDLLQALAPGRKTAKITICQDENTPDKLVLYLNKGNITFAQYGQLTGADSIYEAMAWPSGIWTVEPVAENQLPPPNNQLSTDAILMEGAYRLDEKMKAGHLK